MRFVYTLLFNFFLGLGILPKLKNQTKTNPKYRCSWGPSPWQSTYPLCFWLFEYFLWLMYFFNVFGYFGSFWILNTWTNLDLLCFQNIIFFYRYLNYEPEPSHTWKEPTLIPEKEFQIPSYVQMSRIGAPGSGNPIAHVYSLLLYFICIYKSKICCVGEI